MDNKKYKVVFTEDTGDDYGIVDTEEFASDSYDEIKQYFIKNKEKEKSYYTNGYGNKRDKYYTIYDSNNKNITEQLKKDIEKSDIKKESNKELNKNNNSEQLSDGFYIKITPSQNFDPEFKKFFKKTGIFDKIHSGDSAIAVMQMVNELDQIVKEENFNKNKFPKETLNFEIQTPSGNKLDFNAPMGRNLFQDGNLEKLINIGTEKITNNVLNENDKRDWKKIFEKDQNKKYKIKVNTQSIEKAIDGGIDELAKAGKGLGDDNLEAFLVAFTNSYGLDRKFNFPNENNNKNNDKEQNKENENPINKQNNAITEKELSNIEKLSKEAVSKITKTKEKEKGISKPTSLGIS